MAEFTVDQQGAEFLGQLRGLARNFLDWAKAESQEGHHPPDPGQHAQALQPTQPDTDINEPPPYPKRAAGMLLMAPDGRTLFVRRSPNGDHSGEWGIPGGMANGDNEQPWQTAQRELREEVGDCDCDIASLIDHNYDTKSGLGYTTYGGRVNDAFTPMLNDEHDAFQWTTPDQAPQPLHPGLKATLDFAQDPLTEKGSKIMKSMQSQYGPEKGKSVFYASRNAGKITGVDNPLIPTTGRRDTIIPQAVQGGHSDNPFSANIDKHWQSPRWDQLAQQPLSRPQIDKGWHSPRWDNSWHSPRWQTDQASTGKTAEIEAAVRREGGARDPAAVAAATRAKMIGRPALQAKAAAARRGDGFDALAKQFKLFDSKSGVLYDIDKPLPFARSSTIGTEIGGQDDEWGGPTATDPMTRPAMQSPGAQDPMKRPAMEPQSPAGPMRSAPRQPGSLPMAGMQRGQMGVGRAVGGTAGPKYSQSVKVDYGGGVVDERKFTRPMPGATPPQGPGDWGSPRWAPQQQTDAGWPTSATIGPSAKGAGAAGPTHTIGRRS